MPNLSKISFHSLFYFRILSNLSVGVEYSLHSLIICSLLSFIQHSWHRSVSPFFNNFLIYNVSLDPSLSILILNIYPISLTLCLFNLIYIWVVCFSPYPNHQYSLSVPNSFFQIVLYFASYIILMLIYLFTSFFHPTRSFWYWFSTWSISIFMSCLIICLQC